MVLDQVLELEHSGVQIAEIDHRGKSNLSSGEVELFQRLALGHEPCAVADVFVWRASPEPERLVGGLRCSDRLASRPRRCGLADELGEVVLVTGRPEQVS